MQLSRYNQSIFFTACYENFKGITKRAAVKVTDFSTRCIKFQNRIFFKLQSRITSLVLLLRKISSRSLWSCTKINGIINDRDVAYVENGELLSKFISLSVYYESTTSYFHHYSRLSLHQSSEKFTIDTQDLSVFSKESYSKKTHGNEHTLLKVQIH